MLSLSPFTLACKAVRLVHTKTLAASRAGPLDLLFLKKPLQSFRLDTLQIVNHTHAVLCTISLIQTTKLPTREALTLPAEIIVVSASRLAILDSARDAGLRLAPIITSATRATISSAQESATKAAIHTTRSNESGRSQTLRYGLL